MCQHVVCMHAAEIQREAAQQQGVSEAAKQELRKQAASLMKDMELQKQQAQVSGHMSRWCKAVEACAANLRMHKAIAVVSDARTMARRHGAPLWPLSVQHISCLGLVWQEPA